MAKTGWVVGGVIGVGFLVVLGYQNNDLVTLDEKVNLTYSQVQNVLQRQADLIPNLVETVKGYAKFEQDTLNGITANLSKLGGQINVDPSKIANDPKAQENLYAAQQTLGNTIGRLLSFEVKYPDLKADKGFADLRAELAGSVNRVTVERQRNQVAVNAYNNAIRHFPKSVFATFLGYHQKPYFTADTQKAPQVKF